jgi:hypothetical protein
MSNARKSSSKLPNFETISQLDLPSGRKGKHHELLVHVLQDLQRLEEGRAIRIPLDEFESSVPELRSAINRATRKQELNIATSSDEEFLYVWKVKAN